MSESGPAVFLSYASQDKEVAQRICEALRAAGVQVWFDQSELRGGDAWDAQIRKRIKECALFVPVITPTTNARAEGYFRLEWKLAVDRSHLMADDAPFLFPIVIGDVTDATARVPDKFRDVQWTRLRLDETPGELGARVAKLIDGGSRVETPGAGIGQRSAKRSHWMRNLGMIMGLTLGLVYALRPLWAPARRPEPKPAAVTPAAPATPAVSEARQLVERANAMTLAKYDSTSDDFATAEGLLKRALALDQNDPEVWIFSSLFNTSMRTRGFDHAPVRRDMARRDAERALALAPDSIPALFALGRAQRDFDPTTAAETFNRILQRDPNHVGALSGLAYIEDIIGQPEKSAVLYERLNTLDPAGEPLNRYLQFLLYFHYGRFEEAERSVRRSVELKASTNSQGGLAMVLLTAKGDADGAARALKSARSDPRIVWMTALVQLCRRDADGVLAAVDRLSEEFIQDNWFAGPKAYFTGRAHALAGRTEAARVAWESALAITDAHLKETPGDHHLHIMRGQLLAFLGQPEEALREARTVEELQRGGPEYWFWSPVLIYAALGRADAALPLLEKLAVFDGSKNVAWPLTAALLRLDPIWDKLRDDPRFQKLADRDPAASAVSAVKPDDKSVAVLAFANLSDDKANEYFSDGISEELLNVLAKVPGLKVTARTSSFHFKGMNTAIPEIAQQLGVAYVVEGSVRKAGGKVRITAQLIKAADGFHVWSETFTRDLKDIFAVQDEIAGLIAQNLQLTLRTNTRARPVNPEAFELMLKGRAIFARGVPADYPQGIGFLKDSLAIDPGSAAAWGRLSMGYMLAFAQNVPDWLSRDEILREGRQAADRAIELDPEQSLGHFAKCLIAYLADWDWARADGSMQRVLALTPGDAESLGLAASLELTAGETTHGRETARRGVTLDPLNFLSIYQLIKADWLSGDYVALENNARRLIAIHPDSPYGHTFLSYSLVLRNRAAEAGQAAERVTSASYRLCSLALAHYAQGKTTEADTELEQLKKQFGRTSAYQVAENYAFRKDRDRAFEWLDAAYRERDSGLTLITSDPFLGNLRGDPRWGAFMGKMNLPADGIK
jgi:TolB-like protein